MKTLIIYFSRADENYSVGYVEKGNTEYIVDFVKELTGADTFKVEPLVPYSKDYKTCIEEARKRVGNAPIKEKIEDISNYDTIYIMTPIYWGTMAPELETALEGLDFTGKTIKVVTTHEGSGLGRAIEDVERITNSKVESSIAIRGSKAKDSKEEIRKWLGRS